MTAFSWNLLQVQCSDELVPDISMRRDGHRVIPIRHLPRKPQAVEALLVGIHAELRIPVRAYIEVKFEVAIVCRVVLALQW